jgi:hypothetical protein
MYISYNEILDIESSGKVCKALLGFEWFAWVVKYLYGFYWLLFFVVLCFDFFKFGSVRICLKGFYCIWKRLANVDLM